MHTDGALSIVDTATIDNTLNLAIPKSGVNMIFFNTVVLMYPVLIRDMKENCTI
jgi:hypothetical protein